MLIAIGAVICDIVHLVDDMFRRLGHKWLPTTVLVTAVSTASLSASSADNERQTQDIAVYLTPASKQALAAHLTEIGVKGHADINRIVLRRSCQPSDYFEYEPLFGERVAFRLKGIARTGSGLVAGTGRLSTLAGELRDDHVEPSIPLLAKAEGKEEINHGDIEACIDLPTRITKADVAKGKPFWKGRLVGGTVLDKHYPAEQASFVSLSLDRQMVVDGYLCGSRYVDEEGNCTFDRARDMQQPSSSAPKKKEEPQEPQNNQQIAVKPSSDNGRDTEINVSDDDRKGRTTGEISGEGESECPVCKFMKGGPCKAQFESWDGCVQGLSDSEDLSKCFDVTMKMMECMRKYEYYDVMTAGTHEKFKAAQSATAAANGAATANSAKSDS